MERFKTRVKRKPASQMTPKEKAADAERRKAYNAHQKANRNAPQKKEALDYNPAKGEYNDGGKVGKKVGTRETKEMDCWDGYKKNGTKAGTGKNKGKRVNDCAKVTKESSEQIDELSRKTLGKYVVKSGENQPADSKKRLRRGAIRQKTIAQIRKHDRKHGEPNFKVKHGSEAINRSHFSGHQARSHKEDDTLHYMGKTVWKTKSHAKGEASAYHSAYSKALVGPGDKSGTPTGNKPAAHKLGTKAAKDYTNSNKKHVVATFKSGEYTHNK